MMMAHMYSPLSSILTARPAAGSRPSPSPVNPRPDSSTRLSKQPTKPGLTVPTSQSSLYSHSSEAHIHRIRNANLRSDYGLRCKVTATSLTFHDDFSTIKPEPSMMPSAVRHKQML